MIKKIWVLPAALLLFLFFETHFCSADEPVTPTPAPDSDSYAQGVSLCEAGQFDQALPLLVTASQAQPERAVIYYYLGKCLYRLGDFKKSALNFYLSDQKSSQPRLKNYADQVKDKLSLDDQQWVEQQLKPLPGPPPQAGISLTAATPEKTFLMGNRLGIRFSVSAFLFNLDDFNGILQEKKALLTEYLAIDPRVILTDSVSGVASGLELEPVYSIAPDIEVGAGLTYFFINSPSFHFDDPSINYFAHLDYTTNAFALAAKGRIYFGGNPTVGPRFFLEPSLGLLPVNIQYSDNYQNTSSNPSTNQLGENVGATGLDTGMKLGIDFKMGAGMGFFSIGYQYARAQGFHGTYWNNAAPAYNGTPGTLKIYQDPTVGSYTVFVPDTGAAQAAFNESPAFVASTRDLSFDLSGFRVELGMNFQY